MIPAGHGRREPIIGDRPTGKTTDHHPAQKKRPDASRPASFFKRHSSRRTYGAVTAQLPKTSPSGEGSDDGRRPGLGEGSDGALDRERAEFDKTIDEA